MQNLIGQTLGQYQIVGEIGRGGMAIVYRAHQTSLNRYVAIKVLPPQFTFDESFVDRFLHEARAAAGLKHPNIVTIHDVGAGNGIYYIVMEEIDGRPLNKIVEDEGRLSIERAIRILGQIALALDYAHANGVVHRDIKPSNILVGPGDHATLTDFGIAKAASGTGLTRTGVIVGTPEYMSPEQAMSMTIDHRADIYSLGVVCYEVLGGRVPYTGEFMSVVHAHAYGQPPALRSLNPRLSPAVEQVVHQAMARQPADRFPSAGAFLTALAAAASGKRLTPPPVAVPTTRRATPPPGRAITPAPGKAPTRVRTPAPLPALPPPGGSRGGAMVPAGREPVSWLLPGAGVAVVGIVFVAALIARRSPAMVLPPPTVPAIMAPAAGAGATPAHLLGAPVSPTDAGPPLPLATRTTEARGDAGAKATPINSPTSSSPTTRSPTATAVPTSTSAPAAATATPTRNPTPVLTSLPLPATRTPTHVPPTATQTPPSDTATPTLPTATPTIPFTVTPELTIDTPVTPTDTPVPPTDTPEPPPPTDTPEASSVF